MAKTWTSTSGGVVAETDIRSVVDDAMLRELLSDLEPPTSDDAPFKFVKHNPIPLGE